MDLSAIWNSGTRLDEPSPLDPWPEARDTSEWNPQVDQVNETREEIDRPATPKLSKAGKSTYDEPVTQTLAKWAGAHFNKPLGMNEKQPPRLMAPSEIDSTRNFELYRIHSTIFELNEGDTWVIIDYPMARKSPTMETDCNGITYKSQLFRVHSQNLLKTNSPKFIEMLGPTYQFRVQRRRKLVNKLPADIKYVLDLTPPSEGDELVFQVTELSLTPGITNWWSSSMLHEVDSWLVCGHDDVCTCDKFVPKKDPEKINGLVDELPFDPEMILRMKVKSEDDVYDTPDYRRIPDYCPIRHRNGIIRLLMLIEGKPCLLDSAPRVWTLVKLSKVFDCASVVRDRVAQWLMHGPNTRFTEVFPEEVLQIAFDLQIPEMAQAAFRILVNELALKEAATRVDKVPKQTTIFGRRLGDLPDELSNLVQHAARELVERISGVVANLQNPDMFDYWDLEGWNQLRAIEQLLVQEPNSYAEFALTKLRTFMTALTEEVLQTVNETIFNDILPGDILYKSMDQDRATYVQPKDFETLHMILQRLNIVQQFLCSFTYNELAYKLDNLVFPYNSSKHPASKGISYEKLGDDARNALQIVVNKNPMLVYNEALKPCFVSRSGQVRSPLLDLSKFEIGLRRAMQPICQSWIRYDMEPPLNITRHLLLTLNHNEMKFLPLWAGGCDDGTGGVFESHIPPTDMGPNGPGPSFHTGLSVPSQPSSICGSMLDDLAELKLRGSTIGESMDVHDSISTVYHPGQVIVDDASIVSSAFTVGASDYQDARFGVPVDGQSMGSAVDMLVETTDSETRSTTTDREIVSDVEAEADDDIDFWENESDSDDSVIMIEEGHETSHYIF